MSCNYDRVCIVRPDPITLRYQIPVTDCQLPYSGIASQQIFRRRDVATPKEVTKQLIDFLPDHASWEEIMYELHLRR